jgi:hypothetical protein
VRLQYAGWGLGGYRVEAGAVLIGNTSAYAAAGEWHQDFQHDRAIESNSIAADSVSDGVIEEKGSHGSQGAF